MRVGEEKEPHRHLGAPFSCGSQSPVYPQHSIKCHAQGMGRKGRCPELERGNYNSQDVTFPFGIEAR
jgi:hypothetical protein